MHSSKFGYVLLLGVVFAAPACKVEAHIDDGSGGSAGSGAGTAGTGGSSGSGTAGGATTGGSSGHGGSSGNASAEGGAAGSAEAGAAGVKETGGAAGSTEEAGASGAAGEAATCDTSHFEFPTATCNTGYLSEFTNPTCQDMFLCHGLAYCEASHMACATCLDYLKGTFQSIDSCIEAATQENLATACQEIAANDASQFPQCAPK
jgi:hypothetical protein